MWVAGRWISKLVVIVAALAFLPAVVVVGYMVDTSNHEGRIVRNVELDGVAVGGLTLAELVQRIEIAASSYAQQPLVIDLDDDRIEGNAQAFGFTIDTEATAAAAQAVGRESDFWGGLRAWLGRVRSPAQVSTWFAFDEKAARMALEGDPRVDDRSPREPSIGFDGQRLVLHTGQAGRALDVERTLAAIAALGSPLPLAGDAMHGYWRQIPTAVPPGDAIALFTGLKRRTEAGAFLFTRGTSVFLPPSDFAGWIAVETVDGQLEISFDEIEMYRDVEELFFGYAADELTVTYDVVDDRPVLVSIDDARRVCCDPSIVGTLRSLALGEGHGPIEVPLRAATADESASAIEALGVIEPVGTFTTFHQCCQSRVKNIHRIADITQGALIGPGESFSVNDFVGRRTISNGFVHGGVIYQGRFESDVGGGISQYATTLFNAGFFGGLEMPVYQSHSIYLDRYPYGREATLSYPQPDLMIYNPTEYSVLVWPTYDDTSITVTLYSTVNAIVTETGQAVDRWRSCTRVTTYRERVYEDGTTIEDYVLALYRPSAGYNCEGLAEPDL